jgi:hypothetical protein
MSSGTRPVLARQPSSRVTFAPAGAPSDARAGAPTDDPVPEPPPAVSVPATPRVEPLSALSSSIAHGQTYKSLGQTGQGPFKHSQSSERARFGVRKVAEEIKLALGRIDHHAADLDGVRRGNDRALLAGLEVLIKAARDSERQATKHLTHLKAVGPHRDPRTALRDSLASTAKLARAVLGDLEQHQAILQQHVVLLSSRLDDLEVVYVILQRAVDDQAQHSLTRSANPASPRPHSAPATPRGGVHGGGHSLASVAAQVSGAPSLAAVAQRLSHGGGTVDGDYPCEQQTSKLRRAAAAVAGAQAARGYTGVPWGVRMGPHGV